MKSPTPATIQRARESAGLTRDEAAALIWHTGRAWKNWEIESAPRAMHPALWELWMIKVRALHGLPANWWRS